MAVHVSSNESIQPFILLEWPGPDGVTRSDTDGGSGRGGECFCMVPSATKWIRCVITSANETPGGVLVSLWQPRHPADCDADLVGRASPMLQLDDFGRARVPSRPNMRPPAIDYPGDIDTFYVYATTDGLLTFTVVGQADDAFTPWLRVYDHNGKEIEAAVSTAGHVGRLSVQARRHGGYFLAVTSQDRQGTGEYSLLVRLDQVQ